MPFYSKVKLDDSIQYATHTIQILAESDVIALW